MGVLSTEISCAIYKKHILYILAVFSRLINSPDLDETFLSVQTIQHLKIASC